MSGNLGVGGININETQLRELLKTEIKKADSNLAENKVDAYVEAKVKEFLKDGQIDENELMMIEEFALDDDAKIVETYTKSAEAPKETKEDTRSDFEKKVDAELAEQEKEEAKLASLKAEVANAKANQLHAAISGWGTDEDAVFSILSSVTDKELIEISNAYKELYGKELKKEVLSDFDGLFGWFKGSDYKILEQVFNKAEKALEKAGGDVNKMEDNRTVDQLNNEKLGAIAESLHTAVDGWGTDEDAFAHTFNGANLTNEEWQQLDAIYQEKYGESLIDAIKGDFSGNTEKGYIQFLNSVGVGEDADTSKQMISQYKAGMSKEEIWNAKRDEEAKILAAKLHAAFDRWGTDEDAMSEVLNGDLTSEQIRNVANAYEKLYGESLIDAIKSETSFSTEKWYVTKIEKAFEDNTKDPINLQKYGISDDTKPEDIKPDYDAIAEALHTATSARGGTDELVLNQIIMQNGLTNEQLAELDDAYQAKYNKTLTQLIKDETSGTYEDTLVSRLKAAGIDA